MQPKIKERICPACNGTGVQPITQAVQPGHRIYPVKCAACEGKGKIRDNAN
jgi:DnaJ-class molecular chaperone